MSKPSAKQRLDALKQKQAAIAAQIRAQEQSLAAKQRKIDARRKIIVGALIISHAERNPEFKTWLAAHLAEFVTKENDREVISPLLPPASVSAAFDHATAETTFRPEPEGEPPSQLERLEEIMPLLTATSAV
jgi:hypothetical protein